MLGRPILKPMDKIHVDTFASLLEHGYGLACWCPGCRRWAHADLPSLVTEGFGD